MNESLEFIIYAGWIGTGATATMDLWAIFLKRLFGIASLDYALVGRWIGHFRAGHFRHANIAQTNPIRGERIIGWCAHYLIGITFAGLLLTIQGIEWSRSPSLLPALIVGVVTVVAPFFILQPAMGAGIAASRTTHPGTARMKSLVTHTVYGFGLYFAALISATMLRTL